MRALFDIPDAFWCSVLTPPQRSSEVMREHASVEKPRLRLGISNDEQNCSTDTTLVNAIIDNGRLMVF